MQGFSDIVAEILAVMIIYTPHLNSNLTGSKPQGIPFKIFDFVSVNLLTVQLGRQDDAFYIGTSAKIWFNNPIMDKILKGQKITVPRLRIYDNGRFEIVGGSTSIPANITLALGPVEVSVTGIHFGSHQQEHNGTVRKYNYWGFVGAISIDPLGLDAWGEGIKYYYTIDNDEQAAENGGSADDYKDSFLGFKQLR